jgi:hypothetical protein
VPSGEEISVEVELTPFDWVDNPADWWVAAQTSAGWYRYDYQTKLWLFAGADPLSLTPTYQGALFELPSITVLQASSLPKGQYAIYFAVDMQMNGKLDLNTLYSSVVSVEVRD